MQYLAQFDTSSGPTYVGLVYFPPEPRQKAFYPMRWFQELSRLVRATLAIPGCQLSARTNLRGGWLEQTLFFLAPAEAETALRRYLASYLKLLSVVDGSVELPLGSAAHDRLAYAAPAHLYQLQPAPFQCGQAWLVCDFRLLTGLSELLEESAQLGLDFFHQVNFQSYLLSPEHERRARKNLLAIEMMRGHRASKALLTLQSRLLDRSSGEVVLAEEHCGVNNVEGVQWLQRTLDKRFGQRFAGCKFEPPSFEFINGGLGTAQGGEIDAAKAWAAGFHKAVLVDPADYEIYASIVEQKEIDAFFDWSKTLRRWFEPKLPAQKTLLECHYEEAERLAQAEAAEASAASAKLYLQLAPEGSEFIFVSFRHADFPQIVMVLKEIVAAGYSVWLDRGIPGSSEWNAVIEQKIIQCQLFLLFLSQGAVDSKYVRREVLFADALNKPILTIKLEEPILRRGMRMLLSMYQMVAMDAEDLIDHIKHAWKQVPLLS